MLQFSEAGEEKGRLTVGIEDGAPMLQIYDHAGKKRLMFGLPRAGGPMLRILDEDGKMQTRFP